VTVRLYGVLPEPPAGAPPDPGVPNGVRVVATPAGLAWVRTHDAPDDATESAELQRVLRAALDTGRTPAPARPGTRFANDAELVAALTHSADTWRAALARVHDRVEMLVFVPLGEEIGLQSAQDSDEPRRTRRNSLQSSVSSVSSVVRAPSETSPEPSAGRAYLERLRERLAGTDVAERWRAELRRVLGDCVDADAVVAHPSGHGVLVSHLVARAALPTYRARLDAWRGTPGGLRCTVIGPWAPFSFVDVVPGTATAPDSAPRVVDADHADHADHADAADGGGIEEKGSHP
jgi:hypothetical protein